MEYDERNHTIHAMVNWQYQGKLPPIVDDTLIAPKEMLSVCRQAGYKLTQGAIDWALKTKKLELTKGLISRGVLLTWARWRRFNATFKRETLTARELAKVVWQGYAFAPVFDGRRKKENFVGAWHVALDFDTLDTNSALDTLASDEFAWIFAAFAYSTPSSTPEHPKSRLVFIFPYDEPITSKDEYEELYRALLWRFPHADKSTKDVLRLFYGSPKCDVWANWSIFPKAARDVVIAQHREHLAETAPAPPKLTIKLSGGKYKSYVEKAIENEKARIAQAAVGTVHNAILNAASSIGGLVAAPWAELSYNEALSLLSDEAQRKTHADTGDLAEIERVIKDGLGYGMTHPREEPAVKVPSIRDL